MRVVLSGGEKGSYRSILLSNNVKRIAVNLTQLAIPKKKELILKELLDGADIYLYTSDGDEDVARYDEFLRAHEDELTVVIGRPDYDGEWLGAKYYPLWNDDKDTERLAHLMQKYGRVAISDNAINARTIPRIKQLQTRWGASLIGLTSKTDIIETISWDTVIVSSWTSVVRYGETQIWTGHSLRRYPAQQKESARKRHRNDITRLGVDFDEVMEDDVSAIAKLAVRSWLEWEMHTYGKDTPAAYDPLDDSDEDEFDTSSGGEVATIPAESRDLVKPDSSKQSIAINAPETRHGETRKLLPVMGLETMVHTGSTTDGATEIDPEPVTLIRSQGDVLRNCDSCYLAPRCPAFKEHAECAYQLPVELRTKEQLQAVIRAMIEMQTSRVLFARFAEELEGQGMDPTLSNEMDRLFRLIQQSKDISDTRDLVRIDIEARAGAGALSRIFGTKVGEQAKQLAHPMTTGELDAAIIDAEVI
jgi:hypothetical protein